MWLIVFAVIPYSIFILIVLTGLFKLKRETRKKEIGISGRRDYRNSVSVVVAVKNEEENLEALAESILKTSISNSLKEILIVDDNSTDNTATILDRLASQHSRVKSIPNRGSGKKEALITAYEQVKGDIIVVTDADCLHGWNWLREMLSGFEAGNADMAIGPVNVIAKPGFFNMITRFEYMSIRGVTAGSAALGHPLICSGANMAFRSDLAKDWRKVLRSGITSGDDMFLLQHAKDQKKIISYVNSAEAEVRTILPGRPAGFIHQRARWAGKNFSFTNPAIVMAALSTLVANLVIACLLIWVIADSSILYYFLYAFGLKIVPDFLLLWQMAKNDKSIRLMLLYLPLSLIYPFYVIIVSLAGIARKERW